MNSEHAYELGMHEQIPLSKSTLLISRYLHLYNVVSGIGSNVLVGMRSDDVALWNMTWDKRLLTLTERAIQNNMISASTERTFNNFFRSVDHHNNVYSRWLINDEQLGIFIIDLFKRAAVEMYYTPWQKLGGLLSFHRYKPQPHFRHWLTSVLRFWDSPDTYTDYVVDRLSLYGRDSMLSSQEQTFGIPRQFDNSSTFERTDYEQRREQFARLMRERDEREGRQEN